MYTHLNRLRPLSALLGPLAPRVLVVVGACLFAACAARSQPPATPMKTLARYRDALDRDDPRAAYALLGKAAQQGLPYEQFLQQWQETKEERRAQAAELHQLLAGRPARPGSPPAAQSEPDDDGRPLKARAVVTLPQGAQLILAPTAAERVLSGKPSPWRVLDPDLQVIRAQTPEAVLRLLLTAAEQRNYPALLRLLTKAERQSLEAELTERIDRLRTSLARPPSSASPNSASPSSSETAADRTRIQYDPRFFIDLKREPEGWRIADFN